MSKRNGGGAAIISHMIDDLSEDEFARSDVDMMLTPDSAIENHAPSRRKGAGRPKGVSVPAAKATKVVKAQPASRRTSGASMLGAKKAGATKAAPRKALAEKPNPSDTEEVDDFDAPEEDVEPAPKVRRGRPPKSTINDSVVETAGKPKAGAKKIGKAQAGSSTTKSSRTMKRAPSEQPDMTIPETQPEPMEEDVEPSIEIEDVEPLPTRPTARANSRLGSTSRPLQPRSTGRRGSASDTERPGSDPILRRKLGDMTKKFENMEVKYQNLREVGMQDRDSNFDRLKRAADQRAKDQERLIASLKQELEDQRALARESKALRAQTQDLTAENSRLVLENRKLSTALNDAQNEVKTLSTRLAATRSSAQHTEPSKVPGSAVKPRPVLVGSAEAQKDAQTRQLKEDLYSDLTGLIIRGVKKIDGEDVYDCIQTGRNGTLHFHLSISSFDDAKPSGTSYEDAEFAYMPLLDENRDRDLLDILPDYLTEEICFPRSSAAKFYAKVVDCMTKKIVIEE